MILQHLQINTRAFITAVLSLLLIIMAVPGKAQEGAPKGESFSHKEVEQFIEANNKAAEVQQKSQEKMLKAIEKEDLEINKFNQILEAQQQPQQEVDASKEELEAFNKAVQRIVKIQENMEKEIQTVLEEEIGLNKYEEMAIAYQKDPEFQQRVHEMAEN